MFVHAGGYDPALEAAGLAGVPGAALLPADAALLQLRPLRRYCCGELVAVKRGKGGAKGGWGGAGGGAGAAALPGAAAELALGNGGADAAVPSEVGTEAGLVYGRYVGQVCRADA